MFKKPPTLKPLTPLRSSSRRGFIAHLQALYPVLASASPEIISQVVPSGLKHCSAITSANQKAVIYTDERGKPLWFELGPHAGEALQQSQKKSEKNGQQSQPKLAEVYPTVYTLWILPTLLPRLPTWPQIVDPTLLGGSALMVPGLIPPPNTFPEGKDGQISPPSSAIISITAYPDTVPMVVARSEMSMKEICQKRAAGEKGKAASTIHAKGDYLWEMGGKISPPTQEEIERLESALASNADPGNDIETQNMMENMALTDQIEKNDSHDLVETEEKEANLENNPTFTIAEIDAIMHLALLQSLAFVSKQQNQLPMPLSSLYSSHILPNRPAQWPPREAKGRRTCRLPQYLIVIEREGAERLVDLDTVDIKHTSAKKLAKWIKVAEKDELLKCKEIKGKDIVVTWVNGSHKDLQALSAYYTVDQAQKELTTKSASQDEQPTVTNSSNKTIVVIEKFWKASASSVKLFQEMGASTSEALSQPDIRKYVYSYFTSRQLIDGKNQAQIRLEDPILVHALYPKAQLSEIPVSLSRQEIIDRLLATSCIEYHRSSRLLPERAVQLQQLNSKGVSLQNSVEDFLLPQTESEYVGNVSKGAAKPVTIEIKIRQGRKAVSLITGLETYGIDPHALAHDLMKLGASASATALPTSTPKNPKHEVFVQGDQRKAIYDFIEGHGLDRRYVHLHDSTKK